MITNRRRPTTFVPTPSNNITQERDLTRNIIPFAQRLSCTVAEACIAMGLGRTKLYELIAAGTVETTSIGRRRLVSVLSLLELIECYERHKNVSAVTNGAD